MDEDGRVKVGTDGYVEFRKTGEPVKGEYHCAECGHGITVCRTLPVCPMCASETWEHTAWSPFSRASASVR